MFFHPSGNVIALQFSLGRIPCFAKIPEYSAARTGPRQAPNIQKRDNVAISTLAGRNIY